MGTASNTCARLSIALSLNSTVSHHIPHTMSTEDVTLQRAMGPSVESKLATAKQKKETGDQAFKQGDGKAGTGSAVYGVT